MHKFHNTDKIHKNVNYSPKSYLLSKRRRQPSCHLAILDVHHLSCSDQTTIF